METRPQDGVNQYIAAGCQILEDTRPLVFGCQRDQRSGFPDPHQIAIVGRAWLHKVCGHLGTGLCQVVPGYQAVPAIVPRTDQDRYALAGQVRHAIQDRLRHGTTGVLHHLVVAEPTGVCRSLDGPHFLDRHDLRHPPSITQLCAGFI